MAAFTLETTRTRAAAVIALAGELDLLGAAALERELARLEAEDAADVVVDLRALEFMDSSGLRAIMLGARRVQADGRRFALVPGAAQVMRVFDLTRTRERLHFVDDPEELNGTS